MINLIIFSVLTINYSLNFPFFFEEKIMIQEFGSKGFYFHDQIGFWVLSNGSSKYQFVGYHVKYSRNGIFAIRKELGSENYTLSFDNLILKPGGYYDQFESENSGAPIYTSEQYSNYIKKHKKYSRFGLEYLSGSNADRMLILDKLVDSTKHVNPRWPWFVKK